MFWKSPASCLALFVSRISSSEICCCEESGPMRMRGFTGVLLRPAGLLIRKIQISVRIQISAAAGFSAGWLRISASHRYVTLGKTSVTTYRSCINRIACNSHSDNKKPISGTHVDNKMCDCRPLHSVISGSKQPRLHFWRTLLRPLRALQIP